MISVWCQIFFQGTSKILDRGQTEYANTQSRVFSFCNCKWKEYILDLGGLILKGRSFLPEITSKSAEALKLRWSKAKWHQRPLIRLPFIKKYMHKKWDYCGCEHKLEMWHLTLQKSCDQKSDQIAPCYPNGPFLVPKYLLHWLRYMLR